MAEVGVGRDRDRGSSVAEFVMVLGLLMVLFLGLLQVCLWVYARNILASATSEVSRYAGLDGITDFDVTRRVAERLGDGFASSMRGTLACTRAVGAVTVEVRCTMDGPGIVGLLDGVLPDIEVVGHAAVEG